MILFVVMSWFLVQDYKFTITKIQLEEFCKKHSGGVFISLIKQCRETNVPACREYLMIKRFYGQPLSFFIWLCKWACEGLGHSTTTYPQTERRTRRYQTSLSSGNRSKAVPPGQRWNPCFTCDAHWCSAGQGGDEAETLLVTLRLLKNKNPPAQLQLQADVLQGAEVTGSSVREAPRWWMALRATCAQSAVALTAEQGPSEAAK